MTATQGDPNLLNDPIAQELLRSTIPARLGYTARDGTPRVVPITFHWDGTDIVMGTWPDAPKVTALRERPEVAVTIDSETFPFQVLMVRGPARVEVVDGVTPEYAAAAERYLGTEAGRDWTAQIGEWFPQMARIAVRPAWVGLLDFQSRFPSGIVQAMGGA